MPNKDTGTLGVGTEKKESSVQGTAVISGSNNGQATLGDGTLRTEDADALMFPHRPEHAPSPVICGSNYQVNQRGADDQMLSGETWGDRVIELMYPKRA